MMKDFILIIVQNYILNWEYNILFANLTSLQCKFPQVGQTLQRDNIVNIATHYIRINETLFKSMAISANIRIFAPLKAEASI
jgi:hypothetical protein